MSQSPTGTDAAETSMTSSSPSQAVVAAVADAEGVDVTDLEPLYSVCDPDALDALFEATGQFERAGPAYVRFHYHGYRVSVGSDGQVRLSEE